MNCDEYCEFPDREILDQILTGEIPDFALVDHHCWRRICQVRGRHFYDVNDELWQVICRVRGELGPEPRPSSVS